MPHIKIKENEPFDVALRRFKRSCEKAGVLAEVRKREHYEKPTTVRKRAGAAAVKRHLKKLSRDNRKRVFRAAISRFNASNCALRLCRLIRALSTSANTFSTAF